MTDYKLYREKSLEHARCFVKLQEDITRSTQYFTEDEIGLPLPRGMAIKVMVEYVPRTELDSIMEGR